MNSSNSQVRLVGVTMYAPTGSVDLLRDLGSQWLDRGD